MVKQRTHNATSASSILARPTNTGVSMSDENKKPLKVVFEPGCFNSFEGNQEEIDQIVAEIQRLVESGELLENSVELDEVTFSELDDDEQEFILTALGHEPPSLH